MTETQSPLLVSALIVTRKNSTGDTEVLNVLAHNKTKYGFPGGKIEYGETPAQCLVRELDEELGISVNTFDQIYFTKYEYPERIVCLHFIRCMMASNSSAPMPRENQQLQWLRRGISHRINFLPADEDVALFLGL